MAGRPRRTLAKVTALESRAWDLREDLTQIMPERYMAPDARMGDDPLWLAWYASSYELDGALVWLKKLRNLLEQKVGEGQTPCEDPGNATQPPAERF